MKFSHERIKTNEVKCNFKVTADTFSKALEAAYETKIKPEFVTNGFRKGQVPYSVYTKSRGFTVLESEAVDYLLNEAFKSIIDSKDVQIVGNVTPDLSGIKNNDQGRLALPFEFSIVCPVAPEVKLGKYKGLEIERKVISITNTERDAFIEHERSHYATLEPTTAKAKKGNTVVIDFEGFVNGVAFEGGKAQNHELKLGSNSFIPCFEDQLIGSVAGEEKDVKVKFPTEYHSKDLAGKDAVFKVKVHEVKTTVLPELNDEFVKNLKHKDVETLAQYYNYVVKRLTENATLERDGKLKDDLIKLASKNAQMEVHPLNIDYDTEMRISETKKQVTSQYGLDFNTYLGYLKETEESFREKTRALASEGLMIEYTIQEIKKVENLEASKDDIEKFYQDFATKQNVPPKTVKEQIPVANVKHYLDNLKVVDFVYENAKFKDVKEEKEVKETKQAKEKTTKTA